MKDIRVGEWIRTKRGLIRKVKTIYSGERQFTRTTETLINGKFKVEDIVNHSKNKIELLDLGDYAVLFDESLPAEYIYCIEEKNKKYKINEYRNVKDEDIKLIVTKELMKSIEYRIE